jgi:hypothetical protein
MRPLRYFVVTCLILGTALLVAKDTYSFILLVEVVDVTIQDFDEKLYRHSGVHACVRNPKSPL